MCSEAFCIYNESRKNVCLDCLSLEAWATSVTSVKVMTNKSATITHRFTNKLYFLGNG